VARKHEVRSITWPLLAICYFLRTEMQSFNWVFTLNNPTVEPIDDPHTWRDIRYCVYQLERGDQGTLHVQGYCILKKKKTLTGMKKLNPRAHWAIRRGTHDEARDYCLKEEGRERPGDEWGEPPHRGARTDVATFADAIKTTSMSEKEVFEAFPNEYLRFGSMFDRARLLFVEPRTWFTKGVCYWGPTRTGKSRRAFGENPNAYFKMKNSTADWWDGYTGQEVVIINDFYGWIPYCELLRLLDTYPHRVKIHGGFVNFSAKKIVFTSNKHPKDWYNPLLFPWEGGPLKARFDEQGLIERIGSADEIETQVLTTQDLAEFQSRQIQHPPHDLSRYRSDSPELQ